MANPILPNPGILSSFPGLQDTVRPARVEHPAPSPHFFGF